MRSEFKVRHRVVILDTWARDGVASNVYVPPIIKAWKILKADGIQVTRIHAGKFTDVFARISVFERADAIVIPCVNTLAWDIVHTLRAHLKIRTPVIFHPSGTTSIGFGPGFPAHMIFKYDHFVTTCQAEKKATRLSFPEQAISVVPLPLPPQPKKVRSSGSDQYTKLIYAGRLTSQKNLSTLFWALWILKKYHPDFRFRLTLYGRVHRIGSPAMKMKPDPRFGKTLRSLIRKLGLTGHIDRKGFIPHRRLWESLAREKYVFISPSLHLGENFGIAAYCSVYQRRHAVLSSWGGHQALAGNFPKHAHLVPVHGSTAGPVLNPFELARAILKASQMRDTEPDDRPVPNYTSPVLVSRHFKKVLDQVIRDFCLTTRSVPSTSLEKISSVGPGRSTPAPFGGYQDKEARPFFCAYGMSTNVKFISGSGITLAPWVRIRGGRIVINDPHRGDFNFKMRSGKPRSSVWMFDSKGALVKAPLSFSDVKSLVRGGWAFPIPRGAGEF